MKANKAEVWGFSVFLVFLNTVLSFKGLNTREELNARKEKEKR